MPKKKKAEKKEIPFVEGLRAKEIQDVPLEDINLEDKTFQYRLSSATRDLKSSLLREGQKEPVDLMGTKPYRIIDGFRRVDAIKAIGWKEVKALLHRGINEEDAHKLAFVKNVVRKNLSPMEKANAIFQARQRGRAIGELAEYFGLSPKQLARYEELLDFPPEIQKVLGSGAIPMAHAKVLADFRVKDLQQWVGKIQENGFSARQLKRELRKATGARPAGKKKLYMKREKNVIRIYPFAIRKESPQDEREKVLKVLEDAVGVLRGWE